MANTRQELVDRILNEDEGEQYTLITVSGGIGVLSTGDRKFISDSITTAHSMYVKEDG